MKLYTKMGYLQSESQFGQKKNRIRDTPLTPIKDGSDIFASGFGKVRGIFDEFRDMLSGVPVLGNVSDMLLDNSVVNDIMFVFDAGEAIFTQVGNIAGAIEPYTSPILKEALKEAGLNIGPQISEEDLLANFGPQNRGGAVRGNLSEEARLAGEVDDVSASTVSSPAVFVPIGAPTSTPPPTAIG